VYRFAMAKSGRFVVIEGIDGAGTTTQVARLAARLRAGGVSVLATREPSDGAVGKMIRQILTGQLVNPGGSAPGWETMALLFAADRMNHVETEIAPFVQDGGVVVSDRYDASSLAYQSAMLPRVEGASAIGWIRALNSHARRPDLTIVVDVPAELAAERRHGRGAAAELYERNELQQALAVFYRDLPQHLPVDRVAIVDGGGSVDEVHERVWASYQAIS
jgi:dTMP kinase